MSLHDAKKIAAEICSRLDTSASIASLPSRESAELLLSQWITEERNLKHAKAVAAACEGYAVHYGEDKNLYYIAGLLHDYDNEAYPYKEFQGATEHPLAGINVLIDAGLPHIIVHAILSHAPLLEVPYTTLLSKVLFACDELSGFLMAIRAVRPGETLNGLEWKSVAKKLSNEKFAAGCDRNNIRAGAALLGFADQEELSAHILRVADFIEKKFANPNV